MSDDFEKSMITLEEKLAKVIEQFDVDMKDIHELRKAMDNQFPHGQAGDLEIYNDRIKKINHAMHFLVGCHIHLPLDKKKQDDPHKDVKEARANKPDNRNYDLC